jgi:hypothetical protein
MKRARRTLATYPYVGLNLEGPNFADKDLLAFCGVSVPHGSGLILLDASGAQVPFRALGARSACRAPSHTAMLHEIRASAAECATDETRHVGEGALRVFLVRDAEAFTVPLELHVDGFKPATCARGTRLRVDDAAIVPLSSSTVAELARLARCLALFPPFGAFKPSTPLPLADLVRVLRELRKATRPIPVVITHELALVISLVERAAPGTACRVLSPPYAPLVNVGLSLGELARTISAVLGAEACTQGSPLHAPCNWPCAERGAGGAAPHPASPDGTFAVFTARGEVFGARGFRLMFAAPRAARCDDGAFRVRFHDPLTGVDSEIDVDPRSPVLFAPDAEPLKGARMPPSAPFGAFVDHGASRVLALFRRMFQPCADAAALHAAGSPEQDERAHDEFARLAAEWVAVLPVVQTVAVELTPHSCAVSVAVLLALLRADACVLCGDAGKVAYLARVLVHGFVPLDGVAFTCAAGGAEITVYFSALNALVMRARSFVLRPHRSGVQAITNIGRIFIGALRERPERALFVCMANAPLPGSMHPSVSTETYGAVFSDLAALVYRSAKTEWQSTLRLPQEFLCGLSVIERTSVLPLIEFVEQSRRARSSDAEHAGHFALGISMRAMVALIAQDGPEAVPTDEAPPTSCALCPAFGREGEAEVACAACVASALRAMRLIPETDALAGCSARGARELLCLSDSAARASAIAVASDEPAADALERARAVRELSSLFAVVHLHNPQRSIELERRVPDIELARCSPYVLDVLFARAPDHANTLRRLGISAFFAP